MTIFHMTSFIFSSVGNFANFYCGKYSIMCYCASFSTSALVIEKIGKVQLLFVSMSREINFDEVTWALACGCIIPQNTTQKSISIAFCVSSIRVDHVKNIFPSSFVIIGQYVDIILLRNHINGFCLCITGRKCYTFGPLHHVITLLLCYSPMTW
jgi:hypothetical protein